MKNLKKMDCIALTSSESQKIIGGTDNLSSSSWLTISYIAASVIDGFVSFGKEGGRNAGISVR